MGWMFLRLYGEIQLSIKKPGFHHCVEGANYQVLHMASWSQACSPVTGGSPFLYKILSVSNHSRMQPLGSTFALCSNLRKVLAVHKFVAGERGQNISFNICTDLLITCNPHTSILWASKT